MRCPRRFVLFAALCLWPAVLTAQMTWTRATESAQWPARSGLSLVVLHDTMWIMGGTCWNGSEYVYMNDVWCSADGDSWVRATESAPWQPRSGHTSLVFDDKMWVIGGAYTFFPDYLCLNDAWWSSDGVNWTPACTAALWLPRRLHTSLVFNDTMWVMGGVTDRNVLCNDVWKSADGESWIRATDTAWPTRVGHTAVVFHDTMWVMGGFRTGLRRDVWCSTDGSNWTCVTSAAGWSGRLVHSSVAFDDKMWVMGGSDGSNSHNDVWYSTDGDSWRRATGSAEWTGRSTAASAVYSSRIWVMGGSPDAISFFGDVWYSTGLGVEDTPGPEMRMTDAGATIVRGVLRWGVDGSRQTGGRLELLDASGRKVMALHPGPNDVRQLPAGVYFLRRGDAFDAFRVVIQR